jgi:iron complex outermembrane receptor protein
MTYVQFSTGYRAGGVNPRPYVLDQAVPFSPEKLKAYEVGFKADLFDRALRLNGSVFINKYADILFNKRRRIDHATYRRGLSILLFPAGRQRSAGQD